MNLRIDPELAEVLATMALDPAGQLGDENMIQVMRSTPEILAMLGTELPTDDRVTVENSEVPGPPDAPAVPVRIYTPKASGTPLPALLYFHGGAFVIGDMYLEEHRCLRLAADGGCVVVSVDYRLAPENPFPAGVEDCYCALAWVAAHARTSGSTSTASPSGVPAPVGPSRRPWPRWPATAAGSRWPCSCSSTR